MPLLVIYASYRVNTKSFNRSTFSHDHLWIYLKWIMWCNAIWHHAFLLLCHVILFHKTNILLQTLLSHNHVFTHHICNCAPPFTLPEPLKEIYMNKSMGWRYWILLSALMWDHGKGVIGVTRVAKLAAILEWPLQNERNKILSIWALPPKSPHGGFTWTLKKVFILHSTTHPTKQRGSYLSATTWALIKKFQEWIGKIIH